MSDADPAVPAARRRPTLVVVAVLVLGITFAVVFSRATEPGGISDGPLLKAPAGPDEVPAGPIIEALPPDCGVPDATVAGLAPGAGPEAETGAVLVGGGPTHCRWYSLDGGGAACDRCGDRSENERVISIDITVARGPGPSAITEAMRWVSTGWLGTPEGAGEPAIVDGLGDEAAAYYSTASDLEGASVGFRVRNAVATVRYTGWDAGGAGRAVIPKKAALDGALAAAAETAKSLGGAGRPVVRAAPRSGAPPRKVPEACDTVPGSTADRVARDARRRTGEPTLLAMFKEPTTPLDACAWHAGIPSASEGRERTLTVALAVTDERTPRLGMPAATRHFLSLYRDRRSGESRVGSGESRVGSGESRVGFVDFEPLTGPGERAFAVTRVARSPREGDMGLVVFQKDDVVVEVTYQARDGETELGGRLLIDAAYTVAVAVEKSLEP
ncbi:hypothetical protein GCM10010182_42190 [Actinomadura cremea]|nr:hypothetical protein GCM10010182_42190 [Actinomadura cremea]